jgi:hypothetical protein
MSCQRYATAIADHACGADLAPDVAAHLTACPACAALLVQQRRAMAGLDNELQQMLAVEPSPFFVQRVQAQVRDTASPRRVRGWWWAVAAVAAMVVVGLLLIVDRQRPAPIQVQTQTTPAPSVVPAPSVKDPRNADPRSDDQRSTALTPPPTMRAPVNARHRILPHRPSTKAPELAVQVRPGQIQAVARYMALMRSGRLDTSNLEAKAEEDPTPAELVLDALEVRPITVKELDGTTSSAVERRHE